MKVQRLAVISAVIFLIAAASDVSAGCRYWDCYVSQYATYAECKQIICPSWNTNCNGSNWATDCTVTCDGACWCNYNYCLDI